MTAGVLLLLEYSRRAQLEALAKLAGKEEGFYDAVLLLVARKRLQKLVERRHTRQRRLPRRRCSMGSWRGRAERGMKTGKSKACYQRAKEGFVRLLGEDNAKAVDAAFLFLVGGSNDEKITE